MSKVINKYINKNLCLHCLHYLITERSKQLCHADLGYCQLPEFKGYMARTVCPRFEEKEPAKG